ncbi:Acyl-coenzyme A thioesterase 9, mitochondrial, partial [Armadillidium nasatum]
IDALVENVGASKSFQNNFDRKLLLDLLPRRQEDLPPRRMSDSWDCAVIPLGSDSELREKYLTFLGGVRTGRLLEDMDIFAVWLCYKHILNPLQKEGYPSPYAVVTALVDRIDFHKGVALRADKDIMLEGSVSWVGKSSIETTLLIKQEQDGKWQQVTRAVFVMVARDPLNQGSAVINPLVCDTEEEKRIFHQGEVSKLSRKLIQEESLFVSPPNDTEKTIVHDLFMKMACKDQYSFAPKFKPENSIWMEDTKLKNLIICHQEHRNRFEKVFGGFIMRQAFELSWASAFVYRVYSHFTGLYSLLSKQSGNIFGKIFGGYLMRVAFELSFTNAAVYSKQRPRILHVDDIMFRKPVEIGSLLYLNSQVPFPFLVLLIPPYESIVLPFVPQKCQHGNSVQYNAKGKPVMKEEVKSFIIKVIYTEGRHLQISTKASVVDSVTQTSNLTNIFHLTFEVPNVVDEVIPRTYHEAMLYLDGRRHYQLVRGLRKFYAQGENVKDTPLK